MNVRAHDLTVLLRALLSSLPGATSICVHASEGRALISITASSDKAVLALSEDLELECDIKIGKRRWRRRAMSERDQGTLRIEVAGPPHRGRPPGDDVGGSP
jgi:hypothetical protein